MKNNIATILYIIPLLLLTGCYNQQTNQSNATEKTNFHTLIIQTLPESSPLTSVIESISKPINNIIKKEIGLDENNSIDFFIPKPILRLTLYYVQGIAEHNSQQITSALDRISLQSINYATIQPRIDFFYGQFEEKDELVVMIDDQNNELTQTHNLIKNALHKANNTYQQKNHQNLYNKRESEQHDYIPHIGLGRIRTTSIKNNLQDQSQFMVIFESIQKKIKIFVENYIKETINQNNNKLTINKIGILNLDKKTYIKEYFLY